MHELSDNGNRSNIWRHTGKESSKSDQRHEATDSKSYTNPNYFLSEMSEGRIWMAS